MSTTGMSRLGWYARRAARMSPTEVGWRVRDQMLQVAWSRQQVRPGRIDAATPRPAGERRFAAVLPPDTAERVPEEARAAILDCADRLLRGEWEVLGVTRTDLVRPDWFYDPVTGRRSAPDRYAFRIDHRSESQVGNVKQVWEISRLQHLTLLATAWLLTHEEKYAERVAEHLRSWWQENPFLSGVHWTSGIELGIRLISLVWIRRLLDDWPGVELLFDNDPLALQQIRWHQKYLAAFPSRGSSANNHVIAEAAGQLAASCAFPWFAESERWRRQSARLLERELIRNTFPSGIGRELASDYHCFVAELGFVAALEAEISDHPLSAAAWERMCAMADSAAALVDERLRPPRQGDSDDGCVLLLDAPAPSRWPSLLAMADALVGRLDWWPRPPADASSTIIGALADAKRADRGKACPEASAISPTQELRCCARPEKTRSGADATAARTDTSASPRTLMPMLCRWRSATPAWTSWPTPAPIAITASPRGGHISGLRSRTTPSSSAGRTSRVTAARSCGCGMRGRARSRSSTMAILSGGPPSTTVTPRLIRRSCTVVRCCWTGPRVALTSSMRSKAAATTSALPFTSVPRFR